MKKQKEYNKCEKTTNCIVCESNEFCKAWLEFVLSHNDKKSYAHFDKRVSLEIPSIRKYVMDIEKICKHSFYPFIHFTKKTSKFGKKSPKIRELYYCGHLDRCVYQRYSFLLNQRYNEYAEKIGINDAAIAYRNNLGKNNIDFAKKAFDAIKKREQCFVIVGDFTDFFDSLDHAYLKEMLCKLMEMDRLPKDYFCIFKNISRFASWDWNLIVAQSGNSITEPGVRTKLNKQDTILTKAQFKKNNKGSIIKNKENFGIPQGSPISAVFSNIYMLDFDRKINEYVKKNDGIYMRYSDDFLIIFPCVKKEKIEMHENFISSQVAGIPGLHLQKEKTFKYIYCDEKINLYPENNPSKIDYLGFVFDGTNILLRPKAITKYYYRMRRKAKNIGCRNWKSPYGKNIFARNLYNIYSVNGEQQTFIDYAKKSKRILGLNDPETDALVKHHKRKIAQAIKNASLKNS